MLAGLGASRAFSGIGRIITVTIRVSNGGYQHNGVVVIALIQRVSRSDVTVDGATIASTGRGLLALVAMQPEDTDDTAAALLRKITRYRVFSDDNGKMNLSLLDIKGDLCLVPQFTLAADTSRGLRPGFSTAATPAEGRRLFDVLVGQAQQLTLRVQSGQFGADMQVTLTNDGPATFWLQENAGHR